MANWIQSAIRNKGALRKSLGVKAGRKISDKQLQRALHSKNPTTRKRAVLARTLRKINKRR